MFATVLYRISATAAAAAIITEVNQKLGNQKWAAGAVMTATLNHEIDASKQTCFSFFAAPTPLPLLLARVLVSAAERKSSALHRA